MTHATAQTSIDAYHSMGPKLGSQQKCIVAFLAKHCHRDYTRGEIAVETGMRLSSVCGRCAELIAAQILTEGPRRPDRFTGIAAHPVRLAPEQRELL